MLTERLGVRIKPHLSRARGDIAVQLTLKEVLLAFAQRERVLITSGTHCHVKANLAILTMPFVMGVLSALQLRPA